MIIFWNQRSSRVVRNTSIRKTRNFCVCWMLVCAQSRTQHSIGCKYAISGNNNYQGQKEKKKESMKLEH